jgi:A distinct subfamily of CDD/CDA-like deaminases
LPGIRPKNETLYPDITVIQIHSETNIFRYDENIVFVQRELMPCIQSYRDAHAKGLPYPDEVQQEEQQEQEDQQLVLLGGLARTKSNKTIAAKDVPFSTDWKKSFAITLSFADGSPARNHAIQAALRSYKPTYFHFWQLKTFWHESKIVASDIEVHSFEEMETLPAIETNKLIAAAATIRNSSNSNSSNRHADYDHDPTWILQQVVEEIKAFKEEMAAVLADEDTNSNDINKFWLRKTHKPVLAILAVEVPSASGTKIQFLRGTNMEVSMPTGSLCAERNVIGTALAQNPRLRRQDLKMIAVLAVPPPPPPFAATNPSSLVPLSSSKNSYLHSNYQKAVATMKRSSSMTSIVIDESWDDDGQSRRLHLLHQPTDYVEPTVVHTMPPPLSLPPSALAMTTSSKETPQYNKYNGAVEQVMPSSSAEEDWVLHDAATLGWTGSGESKDTTSADDHGTAKSPSTVDPTKIPALEPTHLEALPRPPPTLPMTMTAVPQSPARRIALYNAPSSASGTTSTTTTTTTSAAGGRYRSSSLSSYSPVLTDSSTVLDSSNNKPTMGSAGTRKHKRTVVVHSHEVRALCVSIARFSGEVVHDDRDTCCRVGYCHHMYLLRTFS